MQENTQVATTPPLSGADLVAQINKALQTIATDFSGAADPASKAWPLCTWADTGNMLLKRRNVAGTAWVVEGVLFKRSTPEYAIADIPASDKGPIDVIGIGRMEWEGAKYSVRKPAFTVFAASGQAIAAVTDTKVLFPVVLDNPGGGFSNSRFQPNVPGYYFISGLISAAASDKVVAALRLNGSVWATNFGANSTGTTEVSQLLPLNGTSDYVELYTRFTNAGSIFGGSSSTTFSGFFVRPLQ